MSRASPSTQHRFQLPFPFHKAVYEVGIVVVHSAEGFFAGIQIGGFALDADDAVGELPGLIAFTNTGENLTIADHSENFAGNFGSRNELKSINNGVIFLEGHEYADDDPRCCPSIKTKTKIVLRDNKLIELK